MTATDAFSATRLPAWQSSDNSLLSLAFGLGVLLLAAAPTGLWAQPPVAQPRTVQSSPPPTAATPRSTPEAAANPSNLGAFTADSSKANKLDQELPRFVKLEERGGQLTALQLAVVTYASPSKSGAQVDLISAVHIGESKYYAELNKLFQRYDVVLYELVAPEGTPAPVLGQQNTSNHPIAWLQEFARNTLGLESQLAKIDYSQPQMLRADLTPQQIAANMQNRGDTPMTLALSTLVDVMRQQNLAAQGNIPSPTGELAAELNLEELLNEPVKLKQVLARQLASSGSLDQALGGALNQLLVVDRNAAALRGLQQQLVAGKQRIGIFYGAAHMPDLHQHLVKDFGLQPQSTRWLTAWDLTYSSLPSLSNPTSLLWRLLETLPR